LLIQASLPGCYWVEGLHIAILNRLPTKAIQVACPHIALFGSAPLYEHLRVFGCTCYPNTAATAPHKLAHRSTRCVLLDYSSDHKGYHCLDQSTNRLIVSRHVAFDEDSFPLAASPNPTDLNFFCVWLHGLHRWNPTHHCRYRGTLPASPGGPSGIPLLASTVRPGFLPRSAPTAASHAAPTSTAAPTAVPDGPPPYEWLASPIAYVRRPRQPAPAGTTPPPSGHLMQEVRVWWCLSRLRRILTGWSHGRMMAFECYLVDSSSPPRLRL
jgi:hypothetical protein